MVADDVDVEDTMVVQVNGKFARYVSDYPTIPYGVPMEVEDESVPEYVGDSDF